MFNRLKIMASAFRKKNAMFQRDWQKSSGGRGGRVGKGNK